MTWKPRLNLNARLPGVVRARSTCVQPMSAVSGATRLKGESAMEPESLMTDLATGMTHVHGKLTEVVFLQGNKNIILVFSDRTMLPTDCDAVSDGRGVVIQGELQKHALYGPLCTALGQSPLQCLAFGYTGTGSRCLARFLRAAGFSSTDVETIAPPLRLRPDGSQVRGVVQGELIEWEDGKKMSNAGLHEMPEYLKSPASRKMRGSGPEKKASWKFWK